MLTNIKIFSSFWILLSCYLLIPIFIQSIEPPKWFYSIDKNIQFQWWMIIPYYSYYLIVIAPPLIWKDEWKIRNITSTLNIITIVCYLFFAIWPIDAIHVLDEVPTKHYPLKLMHDMITYDYLYQNAFASMHVAVSCFLCLAYYNDFKSYKWMSLIIGFSIFFATFLIKQHYLFDSLAGLFIAFSGYYYYKKKTNDYFIPDYWLD